MWPGSSPSAVVNGAAGMIIAALVVAALYAGRDLFMPLALAGLLGFVLAPLVRRLMNWGLPNGLSVVLVAHSRGEPEGQGPVRAFQVGRDRDLAAGRRNGAQN